MKTKFGIFNLTKSKIIDHYGLWLMADGMAQLEEFLHIVEQKKEIKMVNGERVTLRMIK